MVRYAKNIPICSILVALLMLTGCNMQPITPIQPPPEPVPEPLLVEPEPEEDTPSLSDLFYDYYQDWKGVRHRVGGLSKSGIDCSGFVYLSFKDVLNKKLPRSTDDQVRLGQKIERVALQSGDLVFFKIGRKRTQHVGIYIGDNRFIHVSYKRGVMISDMSLDYWEDSYWQSRRLI